MFNFKNKNKPIAMVSKTIYLDAVSFVQTSNGISLILRNGDSAKIYIRPIVNDSVGSYTDQKHLNVLNTQYELVYDYTNKNTSFQSAQLALGSLEYTMDIYNVLSKGFKRSFTPGWKTSTKNIISFVAGAFCFYICTTLVLAFVSRQPNITDISELQKLSSLQNPQSNPSNDLQNTLKRLQKLTPEQIEQFKKAGIPVPNIVSDSRTNSIPPATVSDNNVNLDAPLPEPDDQIPLPPAANSTTLIQIPKNNISQSSQASQASLPNLESAKPNSNLSLNSLRELNQTQPMPWDKESNTNSNASSLPVAENKINNDGSNDQLSDNTQVSSNDLSKRTLEILKTISDNIAAHKPIDVALLKELPPSIVQRLSKSGLLNYVSQNNENTNDTLQTSSAQTSDSNNNLPRENSIKDDQLPSLGNSNISSSQLPVPMTSKLSAAGTVDLRNPNSSPTSLTIVPQSLVRQELSNNQTVGSRTESSISRTRSEYPKSHDKYGIPYLPPDDSWMARGGNLQVPVPGGGDLRTWDDLKTFGLDAGNQ